MAALLRQGARRVGGSVLQRAQAAVASPAAAEGRRPLLVPRRMYTTEEREQVLREIQQKKEELYDAIAKGENSFWTRSYQNMWLKQCLSVQISPRPWSFDWRHDRYARRANSFVVFVFVVLGGLAIRDVEQRMVAEREQREALRADVMVVAEEAGEACC